MRKRILVLGATGGTGREVVSQALARGHDVTAFVRDPARLPIVHERLRLATGTLPDDDGALAAAMRGHDAVISTLGVGNSLKSGGLIARSTPVIIAAMENAGVHRLIFTSAYGVGSTRADVPPVPRLVMRALFRDLYADKEAGENILTRSALEWTLVYPVTLTNGAPSGAYRVGEHLSLRGFPTIPRADVAACLVRLAEDARYVRERVLIAP